MRLILGADNKFAFNAALFLYSKSIVDMIRMIGMAYIPGIAAQIEPIRNMIYAYFTLYLLYYIFVCSKGQVKKGVVWIAFGLLLIIGYSYMFMQCKPIVFQEFIIVFVTRCFPGFLFFYLESDYEDILRYINKLSPIMVLYCVMLLIFQRPDDYMAVSFNMLPFMVFFVAYGMWYGKKKHIIFGILMTVEIFTLGSRGALLSGVIAIGFFAILDLIYNKSKDSKKKFISVMLSCFVIALVAIFFDEGIKFLSALYPDSRTLMLLERGSIDQDSNRFDMWNNIWNAIKNDPISIRGVLADRGFYEYMGGTRQYTHNFILEILYQFGIFIGGLFLFAFFVKLIICFKNAVRDFNQVTLLVGMMIPSTIIQMMFSSSYLNNVNFWCCLGIILIVSKNQICYTDIGGE